MFIHIWALAIPPLLNPCPSSITITQEGTLGAIEVPISMPCLHPEAPEKRRFDQRARFFWITTCRQSAVPVFIQSIQGWHGGGSFRSGTHSRQGKAHLRCSMRTLFLSSCKQPSTVSTFAKGQSVLIPPQHQKRPIGSEFQISCARIKLAQNMHQQELHVNSS